MTQAIVVDETVSLALERHHRRLDELLDRVEIDVEVGDWGEARRKFSLLRGEFEEHVRIDDLMLPSLVSPGRPNKWAGPVGAGHEEIRALLDVVEELLEDEKPIEEATDTLEAKLALQIANEENIIYPLFERVAPLEAYAALALELASLRPLAR
jgi:hypothetical protein